MYNHMEHLFGWTVEGIILTAIFTTIIAIGIVFAYHFIKGGRPWV